MTTPTSERWSQISALLDEALDRPPDERSAYLDRTCADVELRREVEALLNAEAQAPDFLESDAVDHAADLISAVDAASTPPLLEPGQRVGPYRIVEETGRGGMSAVYEAERADGTFQQRVAIKVLRNSLDSTDFTRRFLSERQILASLDHPNIARVFDGGTTDQGRPYFVMEYVEGTPLTIHCDAQRASIEERLHVFLTVAGAVQHAHQNLIVHRDLKPSNILVTGTGTVKLLDFGIAKVLDATANGDDASTPQTRTGLHLMTPEYAAPEQVKGETITTATDVYALGILLYELLTSHRPYQLNKRSPYDIIRAICEEEPTRPSTAVTQVREHASDEAATPVSPEQVGQARRMEPHQLRRALSGELDAIILKALRKHPDERYTTVETLADDVRRYLNDEPVQARADTLVYRTQKFVRRYRWGVATAALILALIVGYAVTITVQAQRIAEERDKSEAITSFLASLVQQSDPLVNGNPNLTVQDVLDRGAERVERELRGQPAVQAELQTAMGRVYTNLGLYAKAEPLLRSALETRRTLLGTDDPNVAQTERALAYMLFRQGHYVLADSLYRHALSSLRDTYGANDPRLIPALNGRALLLEEQGQYAEAEALYRRALALSRISDDAEASSATFLHNLANVLQDQRKFGEAIAYHKRALNAYTAEYGDAHPSVANAKSRMAFTYHQAGMLAEAESLFTEALDAQRAMLPDHHPHLASTLVRMGWMLIDRGQPEEAEPLIREGKAILEQLLPADHWQLAAARGLLGLCWAQEGRFAEAEPPLTASYDTFRRQFGPEDWRTQRTAQALAGLYQAWDKPDEARRYQELLADAQ